MKNAFMSLSFKGCGFKDKTLYMYRQLSLYNLMVHKYPVCWNDYLKNKLHVKKICLANSNNT